MKSKFYKLLIVTVFFALQNCSELTFRSDPMSMTLVKYENRSSNKYIFLAHEGDDCHLLRHKRIHNFFFFFPLNSFSKDEIHEISQQKMIRYKNIMRIGDFAWTLLLLPTTILTYSIEVETCNTGMVAVTRRDPLYLESLKNKKGEIPKEEKAAKLELESDKKKETTKPNSEIARKSINFLPDQELEKTEEPPEAKTDIIPQKKQKRKLRYKERAPDEKEGSQGEADESQREKETNSNGEEYDPRLPPEEVWKSTTVTNEETIEPFNPEIYRKDGTLPIIWNYKNSITNRINEDVKPFSILFPKNGTNLSAEEESKLDAFADEYLESYSTSKILLIGHSEWANGKGTTVTLSQLRAESVRDYLLAKKIPTEKILLTFSGGLWGEINEAKFGKPFSRRVDIVFLY